MLHIKCGILLFLALTWFGITNGMDKHKAMEYLTYFGYMPTGNESMYHESLMQFQKMASIKMTGIMDESTDKMMRKPRCGMPDVMKKRIKRFSIHGSKWRLKNIEYNVVYPANIPHEQIDVPLKRAFKEWTKYTGIKFHSIAGRNAKIQITFKDMQPVGNMTTLLGSAFFPIHGGHISFNGNIPWFSNDCEVNFYHTALHEIGHSLGLGHSRNAGAIMNAMYETPLQELTTDDIDGIRMLYGHHE